MSKESAVKAKVLLDTALTSMQELNRLLRDLSDDDLRFAGLHWQYLIQAIGDPRGGQGTKPIFDTRTSEREKARASVGAIYAQTYSPHYRQELRQKLRKAKMPEPMIWERWPAITEEEKAEQRELEDFWYSRRSRVRREETAEPFDPWTNFLKTKALKAAKVSGQRWQALMQDKDFVQETKKYYDSLEELDLGL